MKDLKGSNWIQTQLRPCWTRNNTYSVCCLYSQSMYCILYCIHSSEKTKHAASRQQSLLPYSVPFCEPGLMSSTKSVSSLKFRVSELRKVGKYNIARRQRVKWLHVSCLTYRKSSVAVCTLTKDPITNLSWCHGWVKVWWFFQSFFFLWWKTMF